ncbi:uncharacterized protein FIBRA_01283 [Fibroporia radiculosa]|uniref:GATA-type domain-containing protein n=1 Tax=Fibroporia radiculosa TaxID=599839 RepID=J4G0W6_9APHY|nr:uncharacterized protein FIBRA_01283 [Fibroporia radiculosa]CCL99268.1 predicted protein [Fibroporia radiculosa]
MSLADAMPHAALHPSSTMSHGSTGSSSSNPSTSTSSISPASTTAAAARQSLGQGPQTAVARDLQNFEFTKRKRWADLLVNELSDAILLVLSAVGRVWYCGTAVGELLGWREDELVDGDLAELMNGASHRAPLPDDRASFRSAFEESVRTRRAMLAYARLQCKNDFYMANDYSSRPREVLFEITGRPHVLPDTDAFQCFFAVAKPYPSRNTAMLNTFLELKMENERLQQRLVQLRAQAGASPGALDAAAPAGAQLAQPLGGTQNGEGFYGVYEDMALPSLSRAGVEGASTGVGAFSEVLGGEDDGEASGPRKKVKRTFMTGEQYVCVTCGRTDSPEWRKGPLGPKTLCNACGLRWAKKVRTDKSGQQDGEGDASGTAAVVF